MENSFKILLLSEKNNKVKYIKPVIDGFDPNINTIPKMTSNTTPNGVARASSQISSSYSAWRAFNKNLPSGSYSRVGDSWAFSSSGSQWLSYEFPEPIVISSYRIYPFYTGATGYPLRTPRSFVLQAKDKDGNWIQLDERSSVNWVKNRGEFFEFENEVKFKEYRIVFDNRDGSTAGIHEWEMFSHITNYVKSSGKKDEVEVSPQELSELDFSTKFKEKHYIQNQSTPLGSGKVFEQLLDIDKIIKKVTIK